MTNIYKKLAFVAAGTFLSVAALDIKSAQAAFSGFYAPSNFTLTNTNANGLVNTNDAPSSVSLTGGNNLSGAFGTTDYTTTAFGSGQVSFDWDYLSFNASPEFDPFGFLLNGDFTQLTDNNGSLSQFDSFTTSVQEGDIFGWRIATIDNAFGAAQATISNFEAPVPAPSPIINGGFETGTFFGWETLGNTSIEDATFGSGPTEGNFQALLTTGEPTVPDFEIEDFLGLESGSLDGLGNGDATAGSVIRQAFTAQAGETLTFDWNFLTDEGTPTFFNDFSFVSITSLSTLADSTFPDFIDSFTIFNEETNFQNFSFTLPASGTYLLGIGVTDVADLIVDSGLLIDNVKLKTKPTPEPTSVLGLLILGSLGLRSKLKKQKKKQ